MVWLVRRFLIFCGVVNLSSENSEIVEENVKVACPFCNQILTHPSAYSGKLRCPACAEKFPIESAIKVATANDDNDEDYLEIQNYKDQRFWLGLAIPTIPPVIILILLSTGISFSGSSPDLLGFMSLMCSLCLWPIIGFTIAFSSGTFVTSFRSGARFSAIVALIIGGLIWMWFLSFVISGDLGRSLR